MSITANINAAPSDLVGLVGVINPGANVVGSLSTGWVNAGAYGQLFATILAGTLGAAATLDAKFEQATDSSGTGVKDITGKAITQLVKASNDDDQAIINLFPGELDIANDFNYVRLTCTVAGATSDYAAILQAMTPRHGPASKNDLASVVEIVT